MLAWLDFVVTIEATTNQHKENIMSKYTTKQLQEALIALRARTDADGVAAYEMTFDEVANRMGDEAFDAWCDKVGF